MRPVPDQFPQAQQQPLQPPLGILQGLFLLDDGGDGFEELPLSHRPGQLPLAQLFSQCTGL